MKHLTPIFLLLFLVFTACKSGSESNTPSETPSPVPKTPSIEPLTKGVLHPSISCQASPTYSYAVYISESAPENAPLLLAFDSHAKGADPVDKYRPLADSLGWIVAGSNSSQNGQDMGAARSIASATLKDIQERASIDPQRLYLAGFSGGARVAAALAQERGDIAGVIGCAAGFQPNPSAQNFSYFGLVGIDDFNYLEFQQLDRLLGPLGSPYLIRYFQGGHEWPPLENMLEATEWMDFRAMAYGVAEREEERIEAKLDALEERKPGGNSYELWKQKREMKSWARGLDPVEASLDKEIGEYRKRTDWQGERERIQALEQEEVEMRERYQFEMATKGVDYWRNEAAELRAKGTKDSERGHLHARVVNYLSLLAYSHCAQYLAQNDLLNAEAFIQKYAFIDPTNSEHAFMLAQVRARQNKPTEALDALEQALELGFDDADRLRNNPQFTSLQGNPRYEALEAQLAQ